MEKSKTNLVIGIGEIGEAIVSILQCDGYDPMKGIIAEGKYDVLHICFPYFENDRTNFIESVISYREKFDADLVIIHSTVPVGTTEKIGSFAVHSPCRGVHPHLEQGIRTFLKFFGGVRASEAENVFPMLCCASTSNAKTTELMKLVDTTVYGVNILMQKEIKSLCEEHGADYEIAYTLSNVSYNAGYEKLGMPQFKKYVLKDYPGLIGGHCIMPNAQLFDSWMCELLNEKNK